MKLDFPFVSNYPNYKAGEVTLLPTPERINALTDYTGRGVCMAFVDSGFSNHPDLAGRVVCHVDASTNHIIEQERVMQTGGASWHGQMTSVIAAGDGRTSGGKFRGVAPEADLILIKVMTPDFRLKEADILRGLQWIYDTRHRFDVRVVNVSVGGDRPTDDPNHMLHRIVRKLVEAGITVVIASGNSGRDKLVPPASAPKAITVGGYDDQNSLDQDMWTLYHHNYGQVYNGEQKPDLLAPANWLASPLLPGSDTAREVGFLADVLGVNSREELQPLLTQAPEALNLSEAQVEHIDFALFNLLQERIYHHKVIDHHHQHVDGTSVATPIVSGVIAQMLQAHPSLTPFEVRSILMDTAIPFDRFPAHRQGAGVLNAAGAVRAAAAARS